ncbi:MAG: OmpA family protein [Acidobacteriia bacterium]|nr:OmpA family protein [Terriglobia bacterium]
MARKKKPEAPENHERWMVSYADFITLMFAFFVVMFASSQTDKSKARMISESVEKALENGKSVSIPPVVAKVLGGTVDDKGQGNAQMRGPGGAQKAAKEEQPTIEELMPSMKHLTQELAEEIKAGKLEVSLEPRGLVVSLKQATFFPSGADTVDSGGFSAIQKVASALNQIPNPIRIEGHTDAIPIHTARFNSNWELSAARAIAMMDLLADRFKVNRERMAIVGYADTMAAASNDTQEGRAKNRRVDIVILSEFALKSEPGKKK